MSTRRLLAMIRNLSTRLTVATVMALAFATVFATAGDDKAANDVAKSVGAG